MLTRREFIKKGGALAGAGIIGAAIVPVATGAAIEPVAVKAAEVVKAAAPRKQAKSSRQKLSPAECWARIPDHIKARLTEANFAQFTADYERSVPEWDNSPTFVTATIEFRWTEYGSERTTNANTA